MRQEWCRNQVSSFRVGRAKGLSGVTGKKQQSLKGGVISQLLQDSGRKTTFFKSSAALI